MEPDEERELKDGPRLWSGQERAEDSREKKRTGKADIDKTGEHGMR